MVLALLELVLPTKERKLSVEKPLHMEVSLQRKNDTSVVHLVNFFAQKRLGTLIHNEQVVPVRGVQVRVRKDSVPLSVTLEPEGKPLEWTYDKHVVTVQVPEVEIHAMVVIR
jgi:hypothetical protein